MSKVVELIKLIRPKHYLKNLFIFAPLFFALRITEADLLLRCFIATLAFSLVAGVIYIINDYKDIVDDKKHPKKKNRPLASGKVQPREAIIFGSIIGVIGFTVAYILSPYAFLLLFSYFLMNLFYSFGLKHIAIVDIFVISLGFVIRIFVGSAVTGIPLTNWIVILVFLLALFLSLAKRRDDVLIYNTTGKKMRKSVDGYNETFLSAAMVITSAVILVSYIFYTSLHETIVKFSSQNLYLTSIFVLFGILRYMQITFVEEKSWSPVEILSKDRFIQLTLIGWICAFGLLIYF